MYLLSGNPFKLEVEFQCLVPPQTEATTVRTATTTSAPTIAHTTQQVYTPAPTAAQTTGSGGHAATTS